MLSHSVLNHQVINFKTIQYFKVNVPFIDPCLISVLLGITIANVNVYSSFGCLCWARVCVCACACVTKNGALVSLAAIEGK